MNGCVFKLPDGRCDKPGRYLMPCIGEACTHQTPSSGDRIRAMTDEELAEMFVEYNNRNDCCPDFGNCNCSASCKECWLDWLKSPVEPGGGLTMAEYIEREAAITTYKTFGHLNLHNALEAFEEIPAADVRPVVLCRDCLHYEMGACLKIYDDGAANKDAWQERNPDDFCSYGEKREES